MNRTLYKDKEHAKLFGVCAGLADYLLLDRTTIRLIAFTTVVLCLPTLLAYFVLAFLLPAKPPRIIGVLNQDEISSLLHSIETHLQEVEFHALRLEDFVSSEFFDTEHQFSTWITNSDRDLF